MRLSRRVATLAMGVLVAFAGVAGTSATLETPAFALSIKHDGVRASAGSETLTYSSYWDGGEGATATIAQDGKTLWTGLADEGDKAWTVSRNGTYVLTHTTFTDGAAGKVETATFVVSGKDEPFADGDIAAVGHAAAYDGAAHGISVTAPDGASVRYSLNESGPFEAENPSFKNVCGVTKVWFEVTKTGFIPYTNSATVAITKRPVTLQSGTKTDFVYDGTAHEFSVLAKSENWFVAGEGITTSNWATVTTVAEGEVDNTFEYAAAEGTDLANYEVTVEYGKIAVVRGAVDPTGDGEEPGDADVPEGGLSKFDAKAVVYDGKGHTIDTNELVKAFNAAMAGAGETTFAYARDDGTGASGHAGRVTLPTGDGDVAWSADPPAFTNAGEHVVWYRVTNPNYEDFVHAAKVTITKRPVTLTSGTKTDFVYDGTAHEFPVLGKSENGFVAGEGIVTSNWATVTTVAQGEVANTFDYAADEGTDLANYEISVVTGKIAVVAAPIPPGPTGAITAAGYTNAYDGASHGVSVAASGLLTAPKVQYKATATAEWQDSSPTYTDVCDTQVWWRVSAPNYADATGTIGLKITPRPITVTVVGKTATFAYDTTEKSVAGYETSTEDTLYDIATNTKFRGDALAADEPTISRTDVGVTAMNLKPADFANIDANFDVTYAVTDGSLTVTLGEIVYVAQGCEVEYDGEGHSVTVSVSAPAGLVLKYALAKDGPYSADAPAFTNVCSDVVVWFALEADQYAAVTNSATVTISKRPLAEASLAAIPDQVYTGAEIKPPLSFTDAGSRKVTDKDYMAVYSDNVRVGTAKVRIAATEGGNYSGELVTSFNIVKATHGDGEEPGGGEVSEGGLSKFDAEAVVYDGKGHTIDTNALVKAFNAAMADAGETTFAYARGDGRGGSGHAGRVTLPTGDGDVAWSELAPTFTNAGEHVVWYRVTNPNYEDFVHAAKVTITKRPVTLQSGTKTDFVYDGTAHEFSVLAKSENWFVAGEGIKTSNWATVTTVAQGEVANTFEYAAIEGTDLANYEISVVTGKIAVVKGSVGPDGGGEPGEGDVPDGGLSKFDAEAVVYDGNGHTIDTNALVKAFKAAMAGDIAVEYAEGGSYAAGGSQFTATEADAMNCVPPSFTGAEAMNCVPPSFTNAGEYVVWYRVTNANYEDFVHAAKVTITKRPVTLTSGTKTDFVYDGTAHEFPVLAKSENWFVAGEGITTSNWVTVTTVAQGAIDNTFEYAAIEGTDLANYDISVVTGKITVVKARFPGQETGGAGISWSVAADAATWMYDGKPHGVTLTGVPSGVTARLSGDTATDAGNYRATVTFDYDAANYEAPAAPAPLDWSITPRPISLQTVNAEKPYDGFPLTVERANITPGLSGYADGECFDYGDLASITEVGETAATFSVRDSATAKTSNYDITIIGGATLKVTVGGDQISVTARDGTWAYDGEEHRLAAWDFVNADKLLAGHEFQIKIADDSVVTTPKDGPEGNGIVSNRFEYVRIVETASGADKTRNYNLFVYEGKLQMTNACVGAEQLTGATDVAKTYDGEAATVAVAADLLQPARVRYSLGGSQFAATDADATSATLPEEGGHAGRVTLGGSQFTATDADATSCVPPAFTHATNAVVWFVVSADYYNDYTGRVAVTVSPRPITISTPTKTKTYDGAPLTFGMDEVEISLTAGADGGAIGDDAMPAGESLVFSDFASITDAGRVAARCAYAAATSAALPDYAVTEAWGTLTVSASADEITVTAADGTWAFDGEAHVLHDYVAENADTLQACDELVVAFAPESVVRTPEDGPNRDGVVTNAIASVRVVRNGTEDVTRNYSIAAYPGLLRMTKATVTFDGEGAVAPSAFSTTATYDGEGHTAAVVAPTLLTSPVTVRYRGAVATSATEEDSGHAGRVTLPTGDAWGEEPPAFTNAGVHTVFYTISAPYYETFAGTATVTISPRPVTLVSEGAEKVYDGTPLRRDVVRVKEGSLGFVDGEGVDATCTSSQTGVGRIENGFNYEFRNGTLSGNYTIIPEFGWLEVTPGTLTVDVETSSYAGVYDGRAHGVTPTFDGTGLNLDACEITYARVSGDESAYSPDMPTFTDVGTYTVYVKIKAQNFLVAYAEMTVMITKATVDPPAVASKPYNGEFQTADVPESALYTVYSNEGGKDVGEHPVMLRLRDSKNWKWATREGVTIAGSFASLTFRITKQDNEWTVEPSIESWRTDEQAKQPVAAAKYGTVTVAYKGTLTTGDAYESPFSPMNPGSYTACFTVKETEDHAGLYREVPFTVTEKTADPINVKATGYLGIYDGKAHSITLTVTGGSGTPTITYATARDGEYSSANPAYTEIGVHTTWYRVEFPNFAPIEGSAVVSISEGGGSGEDDFVTVNPAAGGNSVRIRKTWFAGHDGFAERFGTDFDKAARMGTGKFDANGNEMQVWQDYVAGTDPMDANSRFSASVEVVDGKPTVRWTPALNGDRVKTGERIYKVWGKAGLDDRNWTEVDDETKGAYRFFKVTVDMPEEK